MKRRDGERERERKEEEKKNWSVVGTIFIVSLLYMVVQSLYTVVINIIITYISRYIWDYYVL
jgi:hypothetical protein